jgi:hypothetical protein
MSAPAKMGYIATMTAKAYKDALRRAETRPEHGPEMLAKVAREIEQSIRADKDHATPAERAAIDRGLKAADESRFAGDQIEAIMAKYGLT